MIAAHSTFHRLLQHVVNECRHADEDVWLHLLDHAQIALGAQDFAATRAEAKEAESTRSVMNRPKREVRGVREHIDKLQIVLSAADLHDAISSARKILQIVMSVEEWDRVG